MSIVVHTLLATGESRLKDAGCPEAKIDAELLMRFLMNWDKTELFLGKSRLLGDKQCDSYFELLDTRAAGVPLQYITGTQEFMGISLNVDERALIPRQDTEILVERVLEYMDSAPRQSNWKILDLCTGSGAIAVAICTLRKNVQAVASDISADALALAKKNAVSAGVAGAVKFRQSDLFAAFRKGFMGESFDIIVSNPPYIPTGELPGLAREIYEHEPLLALDGGVDGLEFYRKIAEVSPKHLRRGGGLFLEIGAQQTKAVTLTLTETGKYTEVSVYKDLAGLDRVVCAMAQK